MMILGVDVMGFDKGYSTIGFFACVRACVCALCGSESSIQSGV